MDWTSWSLAAESEMDLRFTVCIWDSGIRTTLTQRAARRKGNSKKNNTNNNNANTKLNKIRNELSALCTLINDRMSITTRTHTHMPILCVLVCMCICPPHVHSFTYTCIRMYMYAEASESSYCNFTANSHNLRQYCEQLRIWWTHFLADANRYKIQMQICMCKYMCNVCLGI